MSGTSDTRELAQPSTSLPRDDAFDLLKGVAICMVMLWHLQPLRGIWQWPIAYPTYVFNYEISLTAVPILFTVSLMLFGERVSRGWRYLVSRLTRLVTLMVILGLLQVALFVVLVHHMPRPSAYNIMMGGPDLPVVGASVFYFLFNLGILTALCWFYLKLPLRFRGWLAAAIVVASLIAFELTSFGFIYIPYYAPWNFFVYVPLADLLSRGGQRWARWFWLLAFLWAASMLRDLSFSGVLPISQHVTGSADPYARTSVVLGALTLIVGVRRFRLLRVHVLELAGRYSLGLYAFHKWAFYFFFVMVERLPVDGRLAELTPAVVTMLAVGVTCGCVFLLSRTRLRFLVA
jgi:peptidoglycan/LPS O-acetylase OafA/YrhL